MEFGNAPQIGDNAATLRQLESDDSCEEEDKCTEGKFVIIQYDGKPYVGQIMVIHGDEIQVNCMTQKCEKNSFLWSEKPDCI